MTRSSLPNWTVMSKLYNIDNTVHIRPQEHRHVPFTSRPPALARAGAARPRAVHGHPRRDRGERRAADDRPRARPLRRGAAVADRRLHAAVRVAAVARRSTG